MNRWESQTQNFITVSEVSEDSYFFIFLIITEGLQASQQQENIFDYEIYMIYCADCLTLNWDLNLEEQIDSIQLWYHYLECLLKL